MSNSIFITLKDVECYSCHIIFGMTQETIDTQKRDGKTFYCPNGHVQNWMKESWQAKLENELQEVRRIRDIERFNRWKAEHERDKALRAKKKLRERIQNGVCPECHRSFDNLRRHMAHKHKIKK